MTRRAIPRVLLPLTAVPLVAALVVLLAADSRAAPGVDFSNVAWGDYDNDGDLDILLTGNSGTGRIAKVYENTGGHGSLSGGSIF